MRIRFFFLTALLMGTVAGPSQGQTTRDTVYLDPSAGTGDGRSPASPARTLPAGYTGRAGVTMLYKRGSVMRGEFPVWSGTAQAPVEVGAYGQGEKPVFMKSISLLKEADWVHDGGNIWHTARDLGSTPCANLVYNGGEYCGAMRWSKAGLAKQGDWFMYDTIGNAIKTYPNLYLYSTANPASVYRSLEYVPIGNYHRFDDKQAYIRVQDIHIQNAGTHGFHFYGTQTTGPHDITIRRCDISYIGGAPFTYRIGINGRWVRFGNAIEVIYHGQLITVEQCRLWENYDASFVVQASCGPQCIDSVVIRRNIMWNAGFDHFDQFWGKGVGRVYFENNTCLNAGGGWPYLTEGRPRLSEFLPDSVGWHVDLDSVGLGSSTLYIRNNIFSNATANRLVKLSTPDQGGWNGVVLDYNLYYQENPQDAIAQFGSRRFLGTSFAEYRAATGKETHGLVGNPLFMAPEKGDYRLRPGSAAIDAGGAGTGGMDFSDSVSGFRGKAPDIGAWEFTGADPVGLTVRDPSIAAERRDVELRSGRVTLAGHAAASWARCEILDADGGKILSAPMRREGEIWTLMPGRPGRAGSEPRFVLIRIRTNQGDYFRSGRF